MNDREVAQTIQQQVQMPDIRKYWCWGSNAFRVIPAGQFNGDYILGGLQFKVSGLKVKGYVQVTLDGTDTYNVYFLNTNKTLLKKYTMIYCDQLQELIDEYIERVAEYKF